MNDDAENLLAQVNALANEHWAALEKPKDTTLVWQYCLTDPLPVSWPADKPQLVFYVFAHGIDITRPTQGEIRAKIWGKIIADENRANEFVALESRLIPEGPKAVRPLTADELKMLNTHPVELLGVQISDEVAKAIKLHYQLQLRLGNIPESLVAVHSDFFNWIK